MKDVINKVIKLAEREILKDLETKTLISGVFSYGSRVSKYYRENSDIDLLLLVETENENADWVIEHHGLIEGYSLELRIYTEARLFDEIRTGHIARALSFTEGKILLDESRILKGMIEFAHTRFAKEYVEIGLNIKSLDYNSRQIMLKHHLNDIFSYLADDRIAQNFVLKQARLMEALSDYIQDAFELWLHKQDEHYVEDLKLLTLLKTSRPARFFDFEKYSFNQFIGDFNSLFKADLNSINVKDAINQFHQDKFQVNLFETRVSDQVLLLKGEL
jgi:predicted nucleotidyltransferase